MNASQSSGRQACPECGVEFEQPESVQDHYFEQHLVAGANVHNGARDARPEERDGPADPGPPDPAGGEPREADPRAGDGGTDDPSIERSTGRHLPDLFVVLFVLVFLGIPATALALALA